MTMTRARLAGLMALVVALGGALRLYHLQAVGGRYAPEIDAEEGYYETGISQLSCHLLAVIPFRAPSDLLPPAFPSFVALTEAFFTLPSPYHARAAKMLLSTLAVATACLLGWLVHSPLAGVFAGVLLAFNVDDILGVSKLNVHAFYGTALLALGAALVLWLERRDAWRAGLLGMMIAVTLLCRVAHVPFPLLFAAACLWRWKFPEGRWRALLPVAAAAALFLAPMALRNGLQFGSYWPFDTKGAELLICSTTGTYLEADLAQALNAAEAIEPGFKSRGLEGRALRKELQVLAVRQILRAPWRYAGYCLLRFIAFWGGLWPYLALGAYALWRGRAGRPLEALVLTAASLSGYALAGGSSQYHVSAVPLLSVIAGAGLASLPFVRSAPAEPAATKRRLRSAVAVLPGVFVAVYAAMVFFLALEMRDHFKPARNASASDPCPDGRALHALKLASMQAGDRGYAALVYAEQANAKPGRAADVRRILARADALKSPAEDQRRRIIELYRETKDDRRALVLLKLLLDRLPRDAGLWLDRVELEARLGERGAALASLARVEGLPARIGDRLRVVRLYRELDEPRRALAALEPLLAQRPGDAGLWVARAELQARTARKEEVLRSLARAEASRPDGDGRRRIAWLYRRYGEYGRALAALEPLTEKEPGDPRLWAARAELQAREGDKGAALRSLERAEAAGPDERERIQMALLYRQLEAYAPALALLEPLLARRPGDAGLWIERADIEALTGARAAALASAARAEAAGPDAAQRRRIVELYRRERASQAAKPETAKPNWLERAEREARAGERANALGALARAEEAGPDDDARRRMALLYRRLEEPARALGLLKPLLERRPKDAGLWLERAELEAKTGAKEAALASLARAEGADGELGLRAALDYQGLGEHGRAIAVLERLIARRPDDGELYSDKGLCEYLKGDAAAAIGDLETAIKLKPAFIPAYLTLGAIHSSKGRYAEALKVYDAGLARNPESAADPLRGALLKERALILPKGAR